MNDVRRLSLLAHRTIIIAGRYSRACHLVMTGWHVEAPLVASIAVASLSPAAGGSVRPLTLTRDGAHSKTKRLSARLRPPVTCT